METHQTDRMTLSDKKLIRCGLPRWVHRAPRVGDLCQLFKSLPGLVLILKVQRSVGDLLTITVCGNRQAMAGYSTRQDQFDVRQFQTQQELILQDIDGKIQ